MISQGHVLDFLLVALRQPPYKGMGSVDEVRWYAEQHDGQVLFAIDSVGSADVDGLLVKPRRGTD